MILEKILGSDCADVDDFRHSGDFGQHFSDSGDGWRLFCKTLIQRGPSTIAIKKVKGHVTEKQVQDITRPFSVALRLAPQTLREHVYVNSEQYETCEEIRLKIKSYVDAKPVDGPKLVESLGQRVVWVACGGAHTAALVRIPDHAAADAEPG